jgi:hypothetical protein
MLLPNQQTIASTELQESISMMYRVQARRGIMALQALEQLDQTHGNAGCFENA